MFHGIRLIHSVPFRSASFDLECGRYESSFSPYHYLPASVLALAELDALLELDTVVSKSPGMMATHA